jgi:hypothetical protein
MLPLPEFFEQPENVLSLSTFILFEGFIVGVELLREGSDIIFDLFHDDRADVKLDIHLAVLLVLGTQVGHLQLYFAELGDDVMETIA